MLIKKHGKTETKEVRKAHGGILSFWHCWKEAKEILPLHFYYFQNVYYCHNAKM